MVKIRELNVKFHEKAIIPHEAFGDFFTTNSTKNYTSVEFVSYDGVTFTLDPVETMDVNEDSNRERMQRYCSDRYNNMTFPFIESMWTTRLNKKLRGIWHVVNLIKK